MPFLRVVRDKRGYETTYLMDWFQEGGRRRSRILYAFRGPSGVRVGKTAMDAATMRELEVLFPSAGFDWKAVLAERQIIEAAPEQRRRRPRRTEQDAESEPVDVEAAEPAAETAVTPATAAPRPPAVPATLSGTTDDERVAELTTLYPSVRERVERRTSDETRRQALLLLAERLNPAEWQHAENRAERLAEAAEALERLSRVLSRRRRGRGRGPGAPAAGAERG